MITLFQRHDGTGKQHALDGSSTSDDWEQIRFLLCEAFTEVLPASVRMAGPTNIPLQHPCLEQRKKYLMLDEPNPCFKSCLLPNWLDFQYHSKEFRREPVKWKLDSREGSIRICYRQWLVSNKPCHLHLTFHSIHGNDHYKCSL